MTTTTKWFAGFNTLLGLWLIAAPFVFSVPTTAMWNAVVVGAAIAVLGVYNYYLTTQGDEVNATVAGVNIFLGLWVIAAPFVFTPGTLAIWNDVLVGVSVAIFAGYNAYEASSTDGPTGQPSDVSA